jgi:ornithine carbamoyltransferase
MNLTDKINKLSQLQSDLYQKDFLLTWEKSEKDLRILLEVAGILKEMRGMNISPRVFDSGLAISNFRDNSTRTRFSFASAANLLGLAVADLDEEKSQIAHGETVRETANMISFLSDFIGIRDDMFLGEGNKYMREVGEALDEGFAKGVLPVRPGIINLQCDIDHPTQSMGRFDAFAKYLRFFRKFEREENRHELGVFTQLWQTAFCSARYHRVNDAFWHASGIGTSRRLWINPRSGGIGS